MPIWLTFICFVFRPTNQYKKILDVHLQSSTFEGIDSKENTFTLASGNLCLMPEFGARINNLSHTVHRANKIGSYFTNSEMVKQPKKSKKEKNKANISNSTESLNETDKCTYDDFKYRFSHLVAY